MASQDPLVSVLLPVYNGGDFLKEAIESILAQTWNNLELIIVNDGSYDASHHIIRQFRDGRLRSFDQSNQGLASTLNRAIRLARGSYLARQDQDDTSFPQRLERQVSFLERHQNCGMVGTWAEIWTGKMQTDRVHRHPSENAHLKFDLLFNNPFVHSSVMLRRAVFERVGLYSTDKARQPPEDYELWSRIARNFEVANIPEVLLVYREIPASMSRDGISPFLDKVTNISFENLLWATGRTSEDNDVKDLAALAHAAYSKVSPHPSIRGMSQVLFEAADRLSALSYVDREVLRARAKLRLNDIRHHYIRCRNSRSRSSGPKRMLERMLSKVMRFSGSHP